MTLRNSIMAGSAFMMMASAASAPALAAGTAAGTAITNSASVNYKVGTVAQTAIAASENVTVDRVVNLSLVDIGGATTMVVPGQTKVALAYTATNTSNATIDIWTTTADVTTGTVAAHGGTDSFNPVLQGYYADTNGNGAYDEGVDEEMPFAHLDEVPADTSRTFFALFDIPAGVPNGAVAGLNIYAKAHEAGEAGVRGVAITQTSGTNTAGIDTVFADTAGPGDDAPRDGRAGVGDDLTVLTAALSVTRSIKVISNFIEGATDPKAIPGALVEYCLQVSNTAGATATDVTVADVLDANLAYDSNYGIYQNGTVTSGTCDANGSAGGFFNPPVVTGTIGTLTPGETRTIRYRARVN